MQLRMIAAVLGISSVCVFPLLPPWWILLSAIPIGILCILCRRSAWSLLLLSLLGMLWAIQYGHGILPAQLPRDLEGRDIWMQGVVSGLPDRSMVRGAPVQRFLLRLQSPLCSDRALRSDCYYGLKKLRLSWYQQDALVPGQRWLLRVRAKRPHGLSNPGGFDYQAWLQQQGVGGVGYVSNGADNELLGRQAFAVDHLRWQLAAYMDKTLAGLKQLPILKALLIGDKRGLQTSQWDLFARTGTTHLMVISGLHIGLVSGLAYWLGRLLVVLLLPRLAAERCAALLAITVAAAYSAAAGFSLPTQRAFIMITVWGLVLLCRRQLAPGLGLLIALLVCLLYDPLAPIGLSFWLSFAAVAVIFYATVGRKAGLVTVTRHYHTQFIVFIGLLPILAILLGRISLQAPLANLLAVPLFSILIVPLNLLAAVLLPVNTGVAIALWRVLDQLLGYGVAYLSVLDSYLPASVLAIPQMPLLAWCLAVSGVLLLLLPRGMPLRSAGLLLLLPLLWLKPLPPPPGEVRLTILDVGQGLSVIVQTRRHSLVYDVGPAFSRDYDTASLVVKPYLQSRGVDHIDRLVISHSDNDHAGGWARLLQQVPVSALSYGEVLPALDDRASACSAGQRWNWDGVWFEFLHPQNSPGHSQNADAKTVSGNNRSCVLMISSAGHRFLLPGDIEQSVELLLLEQRPGQVAADVLVAPHHGSATSSSWAFIKTVAPGHVVFASGYRNQFGHPKPAIVQRYRQIGTTIHKTSVNGAITFNSRKGELLTATHYRQKNPRYWR